MKKNILKIINTLFFNDVLECKILITIVFFAFSIATSAQQIKAPDVKPVSPIAASIFKMLEKPIGTSTGTIPVSFPLFSVSNGPISIPISLDYNSTGGIKVEEVSSDVGLGFNLSAGGRITRIQNGLSDDAPNFGRLVNPLKPSMFDPNNPSHLASVHYNQFDNAPDIFMFNLNGRSGKFMFDESGKIIMMQESDITIKCRLGSNGIEGWDLYDVDGNWYVFTEIETTQHNYYDGGSSRSESGYVSSWLLTSTSDLNGQNIVNFNYQDGGTGINTKSNGYFKLAVSDYYQCDTNSNGSAQTENMVWTTVNEKWLSVVSGKFGRIEFQRTTDRLDGQGGNKLRGISLYDLSNRRIKKIKFNYGYFSSEIYNFNQVTYRLKLNGISEFGYNDTDSLTHSFDYNENVNLPRNFSNAVDYWGYYNGKANNTSPFPNIIAQHYGTTIIHEDLSDKNPDAVFAQANILKKIIFPTGASREILYEANTVLPRLDDQIPAPNQFFNKSFYRNDFSYSGYNVPNLTHFFDINTSNPYSVFHFQLSMVCSPVFRIDIYRISSSGIGEGGELVYSEYQFPSGSLQLSNGDYRIEVFIFNGCPYDNVLQADWNEYKPSTQETIVTPYGKYLARNNVVGGVRVKKVIDFDSVTSKTSSTEYQYNLFSQNPLFTSGLLTTPVRIMNEYDGSCFACRFMMLYSSSCYPLAMEGGSYVTYPEVRTIEEGNGWTDRKYTCVLDELPSEYTYPIVPIINNHSNLRGKLLEEKVFRQDGEQISEKKFTYEQIIPTSIIKGKSIRLFYSAQGRCYDYSVGGMIPNMPGKVTDYEYNDLIICLTSEQEKMYAATGVVNYRTDYSYRIYNGLPMLRSKKIFKSDDSEVENRYSYAHDPISDFGFPLTLTEENSNIILKTKYFSRPLEVLNLQTNNNITRLLGGIKYSFFEGNAGGYHLSQLREYTSNNEFRDIHFSNYDVLGNLREKYVHNGSKEVYIWGYKGSYPVAKILNVDYATVAPFINQAILDSPMSDEQLKSHLATLRNSPQFYNAQITSYTYKPLVGMTSMTDPKGMTTTYEYDDFGRLRLVKDQNGNILKENTYHYQN